MALRDSTNGKAIRQYSIEELKDAANLMRGYDLVALNAAGSGHAGGTLSIMRSRKPRSRSTNSVSCVRSAKNASQ